MSYSKVYIHLYNICVIRMELVVREKLSGRTFGRYGITLRKYLLNRMDVKDCKYVSMEQIDSTHIMVELLEGEHKRNNGYIHEGKEIRKLIKYGKDVLGIAFPPYMVRKMGMENCEEVELRMPDTRHIKVEFIKNMVK